MAEVLVVVQPVPGKVVPLSQVADPVFAEEMLGPGLAVEPTGNTVVAPASGVLTIMYPTGHALVITADFGAQLMVHIGIDTVHMKGDGFAVLAEQGQRVVAGQPLVTFDPEKVAAAGHMATTMVVVMNDPTAQLVFQPGGAPEVAEPL